MLRPQTSASRVSQVATAGCHCTTGHPVVTPASNEHREARSANSRDLTLLGPMGASGSSSDGNSAAWATMRKSRSLESERQVVSSSARGRGRRSERTRGQGWVVAVPSENGATLFSNEGDGRGRRKGRLVAARVGDRTTDL